MYELINYMNVSLMMLRTFNGILFSSSLPVIQWSPTLLLESYHPADFSSNPNQTHLNQLIKVFRAT